MLHQVDEKGISSETADEIGNLVKTRGHPLEVLLELRKEGSKFMQNEGSVVALNELEILFKALKKANALDRIVFDLSLARDLITILVLYTKLCSRVPHRLDPHLSMHVDVVI
jgi:hypothetical protein